MFVGMGVLVGRPTPGGGAETAAVVLIALGACVGPIALLWALNRSTGVSIDRYSRGTARWSTALFTLLAGAFVLQEFVGVPHAVMISSIGAFVLTLVNENRIDTALRERVRTGGDVDGRARVR
jgi:hypothetical protein